MRSSEVKGGVVESQNEINSAVVSTLILWHAYANPHRHSLPAQLLRHRAVLVAPEGLAVAEVVETYTRAILDEGGAK
jgi:hypothetical protein